MYVSCENFFPLHDTFSAGKSSTGSSEDGCSLSLVELSGQRVSFSVSSVWWWCVRACLQWCVWFGVWCLQLKDGQEPEGTPGEVVQWLKNWKT